MSFQSVRHCGAGQGIHYREFTISAERSDNVALTEDDETYLRAWAKGQIYDPLDIQLLKTGKVLRGSLLHHTLHDEISMRELISKIRDSYFQDDLPGMRLQPTLVPRRIDENTAVTYTVFEQRR